MAKDPYNMKQVYKTYAQYVAESKPITRDPAPVGALPKHTKGESHRYRRKLETMKDRGKVFTHKMPVRTDGTINVAKLRRIKGGQDG